MLTRINVLLAAMLVLCALGLVTSQHRARKLFVEVERAQARAAAHEIHWNQLQVEQTELAKAARIDARARGDLGMQSVQAERTLHLSIDPVTRRVSLSQPWRETPARGGVRKAAAAGSLRQAGARAGGAGRGPGERPAVERIVGERSAVERRMGERAAAERNAGERPAGERPVAAGKRPGLGAAQ